jgi:hypothetical protein
MTLFGTIPWGRVDDPRILAAVFAIGFLLSLSERAAATWTSWEMIYWQLRLGVALQFTVGLGQYALGLSASAPLGHIAYVPAEMSLALGAGAGVSTIRAYLHWRLRALSRQITTARAVAEEIKATL